MLSTSVQAKQLDSETRDKCGSEEGIKQLASENKFNLKPNKFQEAALRNQGIDIEAKHIDDVTEYCNKALKGKSQKFSFSTAFVQSISQPKLECSAPWDSDWTGKNCEKSRIFRAPQGYQVCALSYSWRTEGGEARKKVTPTNFYNADEENPDRFRAYELKVWAKGSGNIFEDSRVKIVVYDIILHVIEAKHKNEDRYQIGCEVPENDSGDDIDDIIIPPKP